MSEIGDQKIRVTVGLTSRAVTAADAEAKRIGITFSDQIRRVMDAWVDAREAAHARPIEKVLVLDRDTQSLRHAR